MSNALEEEKEEARREEEEKLRHMIFQIDNTLRENPESFESFRKALCLLIGKIVLESRGSIPPRIIVERLITRVL